MANKEVLEGIGSRIRKGAKCLVCRRSSLPKLLI